MSKETKTESIQISFVFTEKTKNGRGKMNGKFTIATPEKYGEFMKCFSELVNRVKE